MKEVIEVGGIQNIFSAQEILLDSRFEGADAFRLQAGILKRKRRPGKGFFETRFLESGGVGKTQAGFRKSFSAVERQQCQGNPGTPVLPKTLLWMTRPPTMADNLPRVICCCA